ncbi:MAG TPA: sugar phosphate isomerase/epimerase [Caldilineaceae bacterium]|nr:sugar phosphate isomerase/epimerase [Caldilineaceae bacterium]
MNNTISCMSANFVARQLGYRMTGGWGQGDRATNDYFRPLETYEQRLDALLQEIVAMGFQAMDLWNAHLHQTWATDDHIAIAKALLQKHGLAVVSYAGGFGASVEEFTRTCRVATALGIPVLGGSTPLLQQERSALVDTLRRHGLKFGFENHPAEKTAQDVLRQIGEGDEDVIGATVDTGWFGTHGTDAVQALEELAPRLFHIHLKDVLAAGGHDTCRYGRGVVPVRACVEMLKRVGYTGAISVEHEPDHFDPTEDLVANRTMLMEWLAT